MTLNDVIKLSETQIISFKRELWPESDWLYISDGRIMRKRFRHEYTLTKEDIIANDWVMQEPRIKVTRTEITKALVKIANEDTYIHLPALLLASKLYEILTTDDE